MTNKPTISIGTLYQLEEYYHLDLGIADIAPELLENEDIRLLCLQVKTWREALTEKIKTIAEGCEDEMET